MTDLSSAVVTIAFLPSDVTLMWVMFGGSSGVVEIFLFLLAGSISVLPPIYCDILAHTNLEYLSSMKTNLFTELTKAFSRLSFGHDDTIAPPSSCSEYNRDPLAANR
jgi:hypothetical protein